MIRIVLIFICIAGPLVANAAPADVRSGEHATFSRLVISIDPSMDWDVTATTDGYLLTLDTHQDGYNLGTVFERIPRTRLLSATQISKDQLALEVECMCHVDAFLWRPDRLVIDIVDGPASTETAIPLLSSPSPPVTPPASLPNLLTLDRTNDAGTASIDFTATQSTLPAEDLAATETALLEGLARAASQGFLNAPETVFDEPEPATLVEVELPEEISSSPEPTAVPHPGVGISTAMDRDLALLGEALAQNIGSNCLPPDFFAIQDWADATAFHEQAAIRIEALAGEFGQEPLDAQDDLARLYIYYGFGAEARAILASDPALSQSRQILTELAGVVDGQRFEYPLISAQAGCDTAGAMWAFLLNPQRLITEERDRLLQQFFTLPQPLRGQIAPRLSAAFIDVDDPDAAEKLLRATQNQDVADTHETQAAIASVAEEFDEPDVALAVLSQEADDNARTTPASVIRLINLALEQDVLPAETDLLLASALRQEYRNDPVSDDLAVAEAKGRAARGQYQQALDLVAAREDLASLEVRDIVFAHLTSEAPATEFLGFVYAEIPTGLRSETENAIARRLLDLGFPERTALFLEGQAEREAAAERRYLRAEAALMSNDHAAAIDALLGLTDERARDLRARAYEGLGDHSAALGALGPDVAPQDQATLQFRAGAWDRLNIQDDRVLSSFAAAVLDPPNEEEAETLADRRALLDQSQQSRQAVEDLLSRFDGIASSE